MSLSRTEANALARSNAEALQAAKVAGAARLCVTGRNPRRTHHDPLICPLTCFRLEPC
jgi:hypothetical protein